jgi:hypothetical protein
MKIVWCAASGTATSSRSCASSRRTATPGSSVLVDELPGGELRILPTERLREQIKQIGRRVVADHDVALRILAEHDPDSSR